MIRTSQLLVCEALAEMGEIPPDSLETIKSKASFSIPRIEEIEEVVKHDVIAFLTSAGEYIGADARYLHLGMTSSDPLFFPWYDTNGDGAIDEQDLAAVGYFWSGS